MQFGSPLLSDALRERNRRLGRRLFLLIVGLALFSITYILLDN